MATVLLFPSGTDILTFMESTTYSRDPDFKYAVYKRPQDLPYLELRIEPSLDQDCHVCMSDEPGLVQLLKRHKLAFCHVVPRNNHLEVVL